MPAGSPNSRSANGSNARERSWSAATTATSTEPRQPGPIPLGVPVALALAAIALLLWRADPDERRGAGVAALVGGLAVAMPLLLGLFGADYFDGRNLLPVFVPLLLVLGAGFGVRRAGRAGLALAGAFCLCSLVFTVEIDRLPRLQREDLRNAAARSRPAGAGQGRRHQSLLRQPAAAVLPRRQVRRRAAAAAARDRPRRLGDGRRPQCPAAAATRLSPGGIDAGLLRTSP